MSKATLIAHKDTTRISEDALRLVPAPDFTASWRPYAHADVLDTIGRACSEAGLRITRKDYSANAKRTKMFGVWETESATVAGEGYNMALGIRSSIDKSAAVGICAGERVFVCDNLAFSSDVVMFRKHSGALSEEELYVIAKFALRSAMAKFEAFVKWHASLRDVHLNPRQRMLLTVAAMRSGVFAPSHFSDFYELFLASEAKYPGSLFGFHGAITEMHKHGSMLSVQDQNVRLNRFIRYEAPYVFYADAPLDDLDAIHAAGIQEAKNDEIKVQRSRRQLDWAERREIRNEVRRLQQGAGR